MTSPTGGGSEHVSRYRALGEFDNLVRAAKEAKRALKELREEEAKLNAQSIEGDKKVIASKQERAKAEKAGVEEARKSAQQIGAAHTKGVGQGIAAEANSNENRNFVAAATAALKQAYANAGKQSGQAFTRESRQTIQADGNATSKVIADSVEKVREAFQKLGDEAGTKFHIGVRERFRRDKDGVYKSSGFEYSLREFVDRAQRAGEDSGTRYVMGFGDKIKRLNEILPLLGFDKLDLDVGIDDAQDSIKALEFELTRLSHTTTEPRVRIDTNRALVQLRALQKLFKDDVAEDMIKESKRIQDELRKLDGLPSGKAFKFWALTALSDMSRVFAEADRGTSIFTRLRTAIAGGAGGGGGGNIFRTAISGFDQFSESSSRLLQRLSRVSGELYRMPGLIAVFVASLPALISGVGALGGGALGLASGLGAASGVLLAFPALITATISAVGGLSSTFGGMAEILKNAKQAQMQEAEAMEQARLGTEKALTPLQKYNLAMRDLDPSTQKVTEAIVAFSEKWADSQKRIGENFFKEVADQTGRLNELLPIAEQFFGKAAGALGKVADEGIRMITSGPWKADFATISRNNAGVIYEMGKAGLSLLNVFRNIMVAAGPFTTWLTEGLREGADAFSDWSETARDNGTIAAFLGETQESLQSLWQILKNLGNVISSFFKSTVDEGQRYLTTLEDITGHWADVAKAQEAANSPLRQWMIQIRPILSSLGALVGDLARGIAGLATNQNSVQNMVDLLDTLRTDVLPPILSILQHLNDSGIAVTVFKAMGEILQAIETFLESGATQALSVFVTVLAEFFSLIANIASLPVISDILGGLAAGIAAVAAVSIVARFTGLFKLWDFFNWMTRNRGNLSGAFADAARGVAGLSVGANQQLPNNVPSPIANGPGLGGIGSEVRNDPTRSITNTGNAAQTSATKVGIFNRALAGITSAGSTATKALGSLSGFIGGPWGIALVAATIGIGVISADIAKQEKVVRDTKDAWMALADAYGVLQTGDTSTVENLSKTNEQFRNLAAAAEDYGINLTDLAGALNGNEQATERVNSVLDAQAEAYKAAYMEGKESQGVTNLNQLGLKRFRNELDSTAKAQAEANRLTEQATNYARTYESRLGGMTQAQVDNAVAGQDMTKNIRMLSGALDTMSSSSSTSTDRSKALADIISYTKGPLEAATEATEYWNSTLLTLSETAEANGRKLDTKTRAGLRNRDALQEAAKATRELYLQDIASGTPMDQALKRHQARIKELEKEAGKTFDNKKKVKELIDTYGDIPDSIKTDIKTDQKGFAAVYIELSKLQVMQKALQEGKSLSQAQQDWNKESSKFYERYIPGKNYGDGYGAQKFATGGPVWGAGTRRSDSIRAWLSNGEFVQPTDAVEHYGMPVMEAIRTRKLDKAAIQEALPDQSGYAAGGSVHSDGCPSCASGGHKFANGGQVRVPIMVNPKNTKIDKDWVYGPGGAGGIGSGSGGGGWQWQMKVLRQAFPGLDLWSGYRPGSRTLSGNRSYHSLGRAVDIAPRRDVANWIRSNYGARTKELITPFNDLNLHNGKPHRYTGAVWNQHNFAGGNAHNHWAFNQGGLVDLMKMMNVDNMAPSQNAPLPTTPRSLSPAASSVVNNSTDNARTFGDVIINNPMPERAGDSVRDALYRTTLLY